MRVRRKAGGGVRAKGEVTFEGALGSGVRETGSIVHIRPGFGFGCAAGVRSCISVVAGWRSGSGVQGLNSFVQKTRCVAAGPGSSVHGAKSLVRKVPVGRARFGFARVRGGRMRVGPAAMAGSLR